MNRKTDDLSAARGVLTGTAISIAIWALVILALTGCASAVPQFESGDVRRAEYVWQGIHAMDTAQTVTIARSPGCLREANPLASAVYGSDRPSPQRVIVTNLAMAYLHAHVGAWLDRHTEAAMIDPDNESAGGWYLARQTYYVVSLGASGLAVLRNAQGRVGPFTRMSNCTTMNNGLNYRSVARRYYWRHV